MKSKMLCFALAALLLSLFILSALAGQQGYQNLLMASPLSFGIPGLSPQRLEQFAQEEFLLTYEIRRPGTVQAVNQRHSVTVVGTNSHYAGVLNYINLNGGFFTAAAMDAKNRHAVLNETAAFQIFGSVPIAGKTLKLDGESWTVTGVIQDGDAKNANIYTPASVAGGQAEAIIVLMDDRVTEAYAKNALKRIGIHENNYEFINLSKSAAAFGACFTVAWKAALFALLLVLVIRTGHKLLGRLRFYRTKLGDLYFRELVSRYKTDFLKTASDALLFVGAIAAMLRLSLQVLEICLTWQELIWITGELTAGDFGHKLVWLRDAQPICLTVFAACIAGITLNLIGSFCRRRTTTDLKIKSKAEALALYGKSELA